MTKMEIVTPSTSFQEGTPAYLASRGVWTARELTVEASTSLGEGLSWSNYCDVSC